MRNVVLLHLTTPEGAYRPWSHARVTHTRRVPKPPAPAHGAPRPHLPVEQDGLDQGDDVAAGVIPGTDDSNVDCLKSKEHRAGGQTDGRGPSWCFRPCGKEKSPQSLGGGEVIRNQRT